VAGETLWIGVLSGTSADAADAALVRVGEAPGDVRLAAFASLPIDDSLRRELFALGGPVRLRDLLRLDVALGERFAEAALEVLRRAGVARGRVAGIGSHGQTVAHHPEPEVRATLQLGSAAVIHARTGLPVISDFRSADLAQGGQGAPLTPIFHHAVFARAGERRAVLNIGGFTNLTYLPGLDAGRLVAFDPGPGNALLDRCARLASDGRERFDRDGARARRGRIQPRALERLLDDAYFAAPPPKSTGHERFGDAFFESARAAVEREGGTLDDLMATLTALTVESVARAAERFLPGAPERWLICGGGASNPALFDGLAARLGPAPVEGTDGHGVPAGALEAMTFALLGALAARGSPGNLPAATGARRAVVLGSLVPPDAFRSSA
jgi:anhydro-N-acetylmuramic acid kinase